VCAALLRLNGVLAAAYAPEQDCFAGQFESILVDLETIFAAVFAAGKKLGQQGYGQPAQPGSAEKMAARPKRRGKSMKKLQVLGPGCPKCVDLAKRTETAAREAGLDYELEKVSEISKIMAFGVFTTPALVVDGEVKVVGRVPSVAEIKEIIAA
jgi:small redox-active disulfide protein 2